MTSNIVLIGFMGAGKSTIGKRLAEGLSLNFCDSDERIEEVAKTSIANIFELQGEEYFRSLEYKVLSELIQLSGAVISTGGGAIMNKELFDLLLSKGLVIYLDATIETLFERLKDSSNRPLLFGNDPLGQMKKILKLRQPEYMKAHYTIQTDNKGEDEIVGAILAIIRDNIKANKFTLLNNTIL